MVGRDGRGLPPGLMQLVPHDAALVRSRWSKQRGTRRSTAVGLQKSKGDFDCGLQTGPGSRAGA
jgi:hypothetical protein